MKDPVAHAERTALRTAYRLAVFRHRQAMDALVRIATPRGIRSRFRQREHDNALGYANAMRDIAFELGELLELGVPSAVAATAAEIAATKEG